MTYDKTTIDAAAKICSDRATLHLNKSGDTGLGGRIAAALSFECTACAEAISALPSSAAIIVGNRAVDAIDQAISQLKDVRQGLKQGNSIAKPVPYPSQDDYVEGSLAAPDSPLHRGDSERDLSADLRDMVNWPIPEFDGTWPRRTPRCDIADLASKAYEGWPIALRRALDAETKLADAAASIANASACYTDGLKAALAVFEGSYNTVTAITRIRAAIKQHAETATSGLHRLPDRVSGLREAIRVTKTLALHPDASATIGAADRALLAAELERLGGIEAPDHFERDGILYAGSSGFWCQVCEMTTAPGAALARSLYGGNATCKRCYDAMRFLGDGAHNSDVWARGHSAGLRTAAKLVRESNDGLAVLLEKQAAETKPREPRRDMAEGLREAVRILERLNGPGAAGWINGQELLKHLNARAAVLEDPAEGP